jgi:hypothetical protein
MKSPAKRRAFFSSRHIGIRLQGDEAFAKFNCLQSQPLGRANLSSPHEPALYTSGFSASCGASRVCPTAGGRAYAAIHA